VIALRNNMNGGTEALLAEVKSTSVAGPFNHFGPADRRRLSDAAKQAGAAAWLVHWPPNKPAAWIPESEWPA
jgi:hypothetical protein